MNKIAYNIGNFLGWLIIIVLASILFGYPVKWLWNYVMPDLFGLPEIGVLKAVGVYWLCSILFRQKVTISRKE